MMSIKDGIIANGKEEFEWTVGINVIDFVLLKLIQSC